MSLRALPAEERSEPATDAPVGWLEERFQLRKELGDTAAGQQWVGRERATRRAVLVRRVDRRDEQGSARLQRAAAALARLAERYPDGAPGLVGLVCSGELDGDPVLVTDHVDGATLGKVLWWTRPSPPRAVATVVRLCELVEACHAAGVVVRDLHADNVVVGRDPLGREVLWLAGFDGAPSPVSAAPEVLRGAPVDARTDVYGLGLLLYRMLAGRAPFEGREEVVVAAQLGAEPPPLGRFNPRLRVPMGLEDALNRCLAKAPDQRFPTVGELRAALAPLATVPQRDWVLAGGAEATLFPEDTMHEESEPRPSPWWLLVPVVLAAVIVWLLS